jgi:formate hydrogenlyase subunit 4
VLLIPWGLSQRGAALGIAGSILALGAKFLVVAIAVVFVETAQSRLRFYRYQELLAASFVFAVLAIIGTQLS